MEDKVEIAQYLPEIKTVSPRSSLVIAGASFYLQYKRTRSLSIDSTSTWDSLEKATRYAQNIDTVAYVPYDGQMITVKEEGKTNIYVLVIDESLPKNDGRVHCKLEPVASQSFGDERYLRKDVKDTLEKGFTSKDTCDIEGGLNVGKRSVLSGGVVVVADTNYAVAESQKDNPENSNIMTIGLTEIPSGGGFGPSSLGEMDNTDESFDLVPDGNYMMQKRAGVFYPVKAAAAGGGTKLTLTFITSSNMTAVHGKDTQIKYNYSSLLSGEETGEGIATYTLNSKQVASETIAQGEVSFNIGKYLVLGDNVLVVQVTDSYGATRKLTFKINAVSISVTSTFDETKAYTGAISFPYTPLGAVEKTIHFIIDGKEIGTYVTSVSNRQQTYSIPAQSHGAHTLEVYATATIDEVEVESDHIRYDIISIVAGNNTPIIASSFKTTEVEQFGTLQIPYIVYNPAATMSDITLSVNGNTISEQTIDRTRQIWSYRAETAGALELKITCGSVSKTFNLTVSESEINVEPELADLVLFLTSVNRSNNEEGKNIWNYGEIFALLTAFNWATNGWIKTLDGFVALRVNGDARVTIPFNTFANDFRATGKTIEFEFETRDVTDYDAVILSCMNGNIGLEITAQKAMFKSEQSTIETQFKENERVRISFVIEKKAENRLIFVYINGEICGVLQYPEQDNFTQPNPVGITIGNSACTADIFNIRIYDNALNRYQLLDNYIADMDNLDLKRKLYARNNIYDDYGNVSYEKLANQNISFTIIGDLPTFKGDKKKVTLVYEDRERPERSWTAKNVEIDVQGTSSQFYPRKNFKTKCKEGFTMTQSGEHVDKVAIFDGEIPVNVFCFKADFAESSGVHNTGMARLVDYILRGMGFLTEAQKLDPRVRTTVSGRPCVMWHQSSENGDKSFQGKYNFNNDKSTNETFGFKVGCESWEIRNNTSDRVLFKKSDYITVDADGNIEWLKDFEARYPDGNEDYTNLKRLTDWLVSVKDNPAKFREEADQYLDMDFMLSYYTITEFFAMVDQRAKNMFLTTFDGIHWICIFYDNDTCCSLNNEGASAFDYTVECHDKIGSKDVWNGAESTLWNNLEKAYPKEIAAMYADMRSKKLLTYEECIRFLDTEQGDAWCEAVYNEDSWFKYVKPLLDEGNGSYLYAAQGSRKMHRRWWLYNRFKYMDSKYIAGDYKNDFATLRLYTPTEWAGVTPNADMNITSYAGQYVNVQYGSYTIGSRTQRNVPVHIKAPDIQFNDTETIIYGAGQISSLGDLSALYPGTVDVAKMTKLVELLVGSGVEGYRNTNLEVLSVGANNLLRKLDVRNCPNLKQAIDLAQCTNIREVWAEGTGTTAVVLPEGGNLTLLHLPDTITNLTIRNQSQLNESGLSIAGVDNLSTIRWENTNGVNVLSIIDRCLALDNRRLERIRLIGISGHSDNLNALVELSKLKGVDENGNNVDKAIITGTYHVAEATESKLASMQSSFPELDITYDLLKPDSITTFVFSSNTGKEITNAAFTCNLEYEKVDEATYKVIAEDGLTIEYSFNCDNHIELSDTYLVAGTRTAKVNVIYIPLRTIRLKRYNANTYIQNATVTIDKTVYRSDSDGNVTYRGGEAVSGVIRATGYGNKEFTFSKIINDSTNTIELYPLVDVKFIVKDDIGAAVANAIVSCNGEIGETNQYGEWLTELSQGNYEYTITHETHSSWTNTLYVASEPVNANITLTLMMESLKPVENGNIQVLISGTEVSILFGANEASEFIIDWGDGETETKSISRHSTLRCNHAYTISGLYQVEVSNCTEIRSCTVGKELLIAYWSIGDSKICNLSFPYFTKLKYCGDVFKNDSQRTSGIAIFSGCSNLQSVDLSSFPLMENIKSLERLLYGCKNIISIDLSPLGLMTQLESIESLLHGCSGLKTIDLSPLSTLVNVRTLKNLLSGCSGLTSIDLSPLATMTKTETLERLLEYCSGLTSIDLSPLASLVNVTIASSMLSNCTGLTSIDLTAISSMTGLIDIRYLLSNCNKIKVVDLTPLSSLVNIKEINGLLNSCYGLTSIDLTPLASLVNVTNLSYLLAGCSGLTSIDLSPLASLVNASIVHSMLSDCYGLTSIDLTPLANWVNVTDASYLLYSCSKLTSIDLTPLAGWVNVTNASALLSRCSGLTSIDLTPLAKWTKMKSNNNLIESCSKLTFISVLADTPFTLSSSTSLSNGYSCPIYVPDSAVETYKAATNWSAYSSRIKPISEKP